MSNELVTKNLNKVVVPPWVKYSIRRVSRQLQVINQSNLVKMYSLNWIYKVTVCDSIEQTEQPPQ